MSDKIYQDFLKSFRIAFTNCSIYFPEHPIFSQSLERLKKEINLLIQNRLFLLIQIKPEFLIVNGQPLEDEILSKGLADLLHQRKIKSITIKKEMAVQELSEFLVSLSSRKSKILSEGGVKKILKNKKIENILVDELDYLQLIKGQGKEIKDVWNYLLGSKNSQDSSYRADDDFIDNLSRTADKYGVKEILEDEELSKKLLDFFSKLKDENKDNFKKVLKSLVQSVLGGKDLDDIKNKDQLKSLFSYLEPEDLANLLAQLSQSNQSLDPASIRLFSDLISSDTHRKTADKLNENIKTNGKKIDINKIKNLFSSVKGQGIVPIYQEKLLSVSPDVKNKKEARLDYGHLHQNYRLILLDLFFYEANSKRLELILEKVLSEIETDFAKNVDYVGKFATVYKEKISNTQLGDIDAKAKKIWFQAEKNIFEIDNPAKLAFLTGLLSSSTLGAAFYLDKIDAEKFNPLALRLFFKFFPEQSDYLYQKIKSKKDNYSFLRKIIGQLGQVGSPPAYGILKNLFKIVPFAAKIEILNAFKEYSSSDQDFILSIAKSGDFNLRKKSVETAIKFPELQEQIVKTLIGLPNKFGVNSRTILENLEIIEENYVPAADPFLSKLTKYKFFWNRKIRGKAQYILNKYHERKY